jgi:ribosome-binding factor A
LKTVASELAKYKLDIVAVWEVRLVKDDSQAADYCTFLCENGDTSHLLQTGFLFIRESYQQLKG